MIETGCKKNYVGKIGHVKNCIGNFLIERPFCGNRFVYLDNRSARMLNFPGMCLIVSLILF